MNKTVKQLIDEQLIEHYIKLLNDWNKHINLVQTNSLKNVRKRHIEDCLQLIPYLPKDGTIFDIGSGAGFPGVVLAIAGFRNLVLVEKNLKKAVFLKEVRRVLNLNYEVYCGDVYSLHTTTYKIPLFATSRAFSSLQTLIEIMQKLSIPCGLFPRGENGMSEIEKLSNVNYQIINTLLPNVGVLLKIQLL